MGGDFSRVPAYVRTSDSQAVTHSVSRDSHKAGNGESRWQGGLGTFLAHHTPGSRGPLDSSTCSGPDVGMQRKHLLPCERPWPPMGEQDVPRQR